jgi:small multidrug resistance pump
MRDGPESPVAASEPQPASSTRSAGTPKSRNRTLLILAAGIALEVAASLSLQAAIKTPIWFIVVIAGYTSSFALLSTVLRRGMPLGVAYGIWAASGTALTASSAAIIFGQELTGITLVGIALVIVGVLCIELGSDATPTDHRTTGLRADKPNNEPVLP